MIPIEKQTSKKIKSSLCSRYYTEACVYIVEACVYIVEAYIVEVCVSLLLLETKIIKYHVESGRAHLCCLCNTILNPEKKKKNVAAVASCFFAEMFQTFA